MGQAKNRGSVEQRVKEAIARERAKFPETVKCNNCQKDLSEITPLTGDLGIEGLRLAGVANCEDCESTTWVLDGTDEALAKVSFAMDAIHDGDVKSGLALKPE